MAHDVFISYSTKNTTEAQQVCAALEGAGIRCWMAPRDVPAGANWGGAINRAIKDGKIFLLLVSDVSNGSDQVLKEVVIADREKKKLIPFFIEAVTLSDDLDYYLPSKQWVIGYPPPLTNYLPNLIKNIRSLLPTSTMPAGINHIPKVEAVSLGVTERQIDEVFQKVVESTSRIEIPHTHKPAELSVPTAVTTRVREKDGMVEVYVPAGEFVMGSLDDEPEAWENEKPQHKVYLDAYWMDRTPVTNAMFARFLSEMGNQEERGSKWFASERSRIRLENNIWQILPGYEHHPAVMMTWYGARAYAKWAGARLPSEAQWEKAARGTNGRKYPWGSPPDQTLANYARHIGETTPVDNYPAGASPYGALGMAGNVWEWCADWYDEHFYQNLPPKNPQGPTSGFERVCRGGSWGDGDVILRTAFRYKTNPDVVGALLGFRCVRSA